MQFSTFSKSRPIFNLLAKASFAELEPILVRILDFLSILEIMPLKLINKGFRKMIGNNSFHHIVLPKLKKLSNMEALRLFAHFSKIRVIEMDTARVASAEI